MNIESYQKQAIIDYVKKDGLISSPSCKGIISDFEKKIANYFNRKFVLLTTNGTSALTLAYLSTTSKNTPVLVSDYAHYAAIHPLHNITNKIMPVPVDENTLEIDLNSLEKKLQGMPSSTKPIILNVIMTGYSTKSNSLRKLADKYGAYYIEDCSRAYLCEDNGLIGTKGDISCFSMQGSKALNAGEGGLFLTDQEDLYKKAINLAFPGRRHHTNKIKTPIESEYHIFKFRPNPLSAVIANSQLPHLQKRVNNSRDNLKILADILNSESKLKVINTNSICNRGGWKDAYVLSSDLNYASKLIKILRENNISVRKEFSDAFVEGLNKDIFSKLLIFEGFSKYDKYNWKDIEKLNKIKRIIKKEV